jgi:probable O-glycosylation ligase (exosortase A-associated)
MFWLWISTMNPHRLTYGFMNDAPVAQAMALCILIGMLQTSEKRSPWLGAPMNWFAVLIAWMCITTAAAYYPEPSFDQLTKVLKIDLMIFVTVMLVRTRREMMVFAWIMVLSVAFYGVKGGLFTLASGGGSRVYGPPASYIQENNALAVAVIMTLPLLRFLQMTLEKAWQRHLMTGAMLLCGVAVLGSHSRGALLAISAMLAVLWWRGKNKLGMGMGLLVVGAAALAFMPESWWSRMETIETYQSDTSAMGRINAWTMAFNLAKDNLLGGGFAIWNKNLFAVYAPNPDFVVSAHSIYFHMIGEHGFIGLAIYLGFWISTWFSAEWLRKNGPKHPQSEWCGQLGAMVQVALIGFAVGGAFLSLAYFDLPYNLMALTVVAQAWVRTRGWELEGPMAPHGRFLGIPLFFGDRLLKHRIGTPEAAERNRP